LFVIRRLMVLVLIAFGFAAGVYVGVSMTRSRSVVPTTTDEPSPPRTPVDTRRADPSPRPPAPPPADRRRPATNPAPATSAARAASVPVATVGILNIDSDVPGAQVFIDREFVGAAPVTAHEVKPGSHRVNVSASGFEGVAETIDVLPGPRDVLIKLKEVRLNVTLDVVHKHRIGSCQGRLSATPRGIRYETTDKDDAFISPLAELETFEVDYPKKNLKLKLKNGKTYDFTDPAGNADRLFVFQRDVEHARDRLRTGDAPATK
jgi:hypothetical protein